MLSSSEGKYLIELARKAIETYLKENEIISIPHDTPEKLLEKRGVFVTITENGNLRGCIGYCEPLQPLIKGLIEVAISSATADPRFDPLKESDIEKIDLEISVLTKPRLIEVNNPQEYINKIEIGKDGLIIEKGLYKGLLLPQVAVEWEWDQEELLCNTCMKAGLAPDCWLDSKTKIFSFQAQIFKEKKII